jgi:hypothetical protein
MIARTSPGDTARRSLGATDPNEPERADQGGASPRTPVVADPSALPRGDRDEVFESVAVALLVLFGSRLQLVVVPREPGT